jgi:ADP-heptose:LPS heptosyltransferase
MALIEHASFVVANDSAALHIAVGLDRPIVALFGPTRVNRVGPYGREADVLQVLQTRDRFDHKDASSRLMMERIEVQSVWDRCTAAMARSKASSVGVQG